MKALKTVAVALGITLRRSSSSRSPSWPDSSSG